MLQFPKTPTGLVRRGAIALATGRRTGTTILAAIGRTVTGIHPAFVALTLLVLLGAGFGIARVDDEGTWHLLAAHFPSAPPLPAGDAYILSSPVGPAVAHVLGFTTSTGYAEMSAGCVVAAVATTAAGLWRRAGRPGVVLGLVMLFTSPLAWLLPRWLDKEDPFLLLGAALLVLFDTPAAVAAGAALMATANGPVACFAVLAVVALSVVEGEVDRRCCAVAAIAGLVAGLLLTAGYDLHAGFGLVGRLSAARQAGVGALTSEMATGLWPWTLSVIPTTVLVVVAARTDTGRRWTSWVLAALGGVALVMTALTHDETRVFTLLTWPIVLWGVTRVARRSGVNALVGGFMAAGLLLPRLVVEQGHTYVDWLHPVSRLLGA
jgi:hypothetical protein